MRHTENTRQARNLFMDRPLPDRVVRLETAFSLLETDGQE
jgi:hypothetical protein